jgi:hypothetical protein
MKISHLLGGVSAALLASWCLACSLVQSAAEGTFLQNSISLIAFSCVLGGVAGVLVAALSAWLLRRYSPAKLAEDITPNTVALRVFAVIIAATALHGGTHGYSVGRANAEKEERAEEQAHEAKAAAEGAALALRQKHAAELTDIQARLERMPSLGTGTPAWKAEATQLARQVEALPEMPERASIAAEHKRQIAPYQAEQAALSNNRVADCLTRRDCAYHLNGIASATPYLQLAVINTEGTQWSYSDWAAAVRATRQEAIWAQSNPESALRRWEELPATAPFFPRAASNIRDGLRTFSVGIAAERKKKSPRIGVPGWITVNAPERDQVPLQGEKVVSNAPAASPRAIETKHSQPTPVGPEELREMIDQLARLAPGSDPWERKLIAVAEALRHLPDSAEKTAIRTKLRKQEGAHVHAVAKRETQALLAISSDGASYDHNKADPGIEKAIRKYFGLD